MSCFVPQEGIVSYDLSTSEVAQSMASKTPKPAKVIMQSQIIMKLIATTHLQQFFIAVFYFAKRNIAFVVGFEILDVAHAGMRIFDIGQRL